MHEIASIMKVRNTDYLEWQTKIQHLKKETEFLETVIKQEIKEREISQDKIKQLEKENAELKISLKSIAEDNLKLASKLANQKYLNQIEVEKVFDDCLPQEYNNAEEKIITMEDEANIVTAICNLARVEVSK